VQTTPSLPLPRDWRDRSESPLLRRASGEKLLSSVLRYKTTAWRASKKIPAFLHSVVYVYAKGDVFMVFAEKNVFSEKN
jgi:hypothetical protein